MWLWCQPTLLISSLDVVYTVLVYAERNFLFKMLYVKTKTKKWLSCSKYGWMEILNKI